jgi:tetratricopeptide (TPR) repeat protein
MFILFCVIAVTAYIMRTVFVFLFLAWVIGCSTDDYNARQKKIERLIELAAVSDSLGQLQESISHYTTILEIDSTNIFALINRGRALVWAGKLKEGFSDFDRSVNLYPNEITYFKRGMAFVIVKEYNRAADDFTMCIQLDSTSAEAYYGFSFVDEAQGRFDSALMNLDRAHKYKYPLQEIEERRAALFETNGGYQTAIEILTNLIQLDPGNAKYYNNRGYDKIQIGQFFASIDDLNMAISLDSSMAFAHSNKAYALLKENQLADALKCINTSLELDGKNAYAFRTRGDIYLVLHRLNEACADLAHAEKLTSDNILKKEILASKEQACGK